MIEPEPFGVTRGGLPVARHRLRNARGTEAVLIDYGASLTELWVDGVDVVLGFDSLAGYEAHRTWFGCVVGRVANRTAGARFEIDGEAFELESNEGTHHLHGGSQGLSTRVWQPEPTDGGLRFNVTSEPGDGGYPGRLDVAVTYHLTDDDRLRIEYRATVDRATPVNLTHHAYFNLAGHGDVRGHELEIGSSRVVEVGPDLIPTGVLREVAETPFDFRKAKPVGRDLEAAPGQGYDVSYVLAGFDDAQARASLRPARVATLIEPRSGRRMGVSTSAPCLHLYTGQALDGRRGKRGARLDAFGGLCLEAQHPPDALHQAGFPSIVCRPGTPYHQVTEYDFAAANEVDSGEV